MNRSAKQHLAKAMDYVAKGEEFYRKAAEEIVAAQKADPTLTQREVGEEFGMSKEWVRDLVRWHTTGHPDARTSPFGGPRDARIRSETKRFLRDAAPEEIAKMVTDLDAGKRVEVARAIDRESLKRQREREKVADDKFRDTVGDETADDLELAQDLKDSEWWLVKANQDVQSFLKTANEIGVENMPDRWRESCLTWFGYIDGNLGMAKALLQGEDVDWTAFEDLLKEVN